MNKKIYQFLGLTNADNDDELLIRDTSESKTKKISVLNLLKGVVALITNHKNDKDNPHDVTTEQIGADEAGAAEAVDTKLTSHKNNKNNPHEVTRQQIGAETAGAAAGVQSNLNSHKLDHNNPHQVTANQIGAALKGSVDDLEEALDAHEDDHANPHETTAGQIGADVAGSAHAVDDKLTAHKNDKQNPHTVTKDQVGLGNVTNDLQVKASEKGAANGVATLGSDGKIPTTQIPALAINETFVVNTQAAMLALSAQRGDVAIRLDLVKTYILATDDPTQLGNWKEVLTPPAPVQSVNNKVGNVSLDKTDIGLENVTDDAQVKRSEMGEANGVATLDEHGIVPTDQLPEAPSFVDNEIPTGLIDGENVVFELAHTPKEGSLHLYLNGMRMTPGEDNDYTILSNAITFNNAPAEGNMVADYRK